MIIFRLSLEHAAQMPDVDGHGEDDGGVVLGSYGVQCLQVSQLKQICLTNGNYDQFQWHEIEFFRHDSFSSSDCS